MGWWDFPDENESKHDLIRICFNYAQIESNYKFHKFVYGRLKSSSNSFPSRTSHRSTDNTTVNIESKI